LYWELREANRHRISQAQPQSITKNISHDDLDAIMDQFKAALNVKCDFCHSPRKDDPKKMDFASDEKPEKEIARDMLRMTARLIRNSFISRVERRRR
jgi:hypothetical protein